MKVIILLANGFEEVEALAQVDFLRRAGIEVDTVSIHETLEVIGQNKITIIADNLYTQINQDDYDAVILPGGKIGMLNLQEDTRVLALIKKYYEGQKVIAAICAAPSILGKLNLLVGKKCICYPGFEDYLCGANLINERVVIDGNIITSKGPGTSFDFAIAIIQKLCGATLAQEIYTKTQM